MSYKPVEYVNVLQQYSTSQFIESNCAEIAFLNNGTSSFLINDTLQLLPTQFISFDGKKGELDLTRYNITFQNTGAQLNSCIVVRKRYNNYDDIDQ